MLRTLRPVAVALVAGSVLLGYAGPANAQTTTTKQTTTTTTTTTTTLLPHPFSKGTAACVRQARTARKACRRTGGTHCFSTFATAYANCFAAGAGVKCASKCVTTEATCFSKVPTTRKNCRKSCVSAKKADVTACRRIANDDNIWAGGDASCLSTAAGNFDLCRSVCRDAKIDCRTALKFCVANCANL